MLNLLLALLAGIVTIAAPCTLPVLPILLGASVGQDSKTRPAFIALGFVASFTVVALLIGSLTRALKAENGFMPEEDGLSIIRDLKSRSNVPVIMLTATASPIDRVVGLELGADDYLAKPCELRELMARIRSVLRRSTPAKGAAAPAAEAAKTNKEALVRFGTKWLDLDAQALRDDEGNEHPLTASEYGLLKVFAANPKRVLSRERLLELANARDSEAFDRAVDLRIMRIRRKIEPDPARPSVIRTIRGGGYLFSPSDEKA